LKIQLAGLVALAVLLFGCTTAEKADGQVASDVDKRSFDYRFPDGLEQTADSEARLDQWFRDAKFGAFIHFGIPSSLAGMYKGKVSDHRYGEWIYFAERIPTEEYRELAATFDPEKFDADEWVRVFKDARMRYVVLTSKHHDGFALFESSVSDFNIVDATPFKRDIVKELSEASHRAGLKFGVYYSHAQDWDDPNSAFDKRFTQKEIHPDLPGGFQPDLDRYLDEKELPQIEELVKNYEIDLIWFDTPHEMTYERAKRFTDVVRKHRPDCLINSRIIKMGIGRMEQDILDLFDYVSIGDKEVPNRKLPLYFESPDSVSSSYGYKAHGKFFYHTGKELIDRMVHTIAAGGNYLLNNGPMGNGALDPEAVRLYGIIGEWMKLNSESLIDTRANPFADRPNWGDITASKMGDTLYLHVLEWPDTGSLTLNGVADQVTSANYLTNGVAADFVQTGNALTFTLPVEPLDEYDTAFSLLWHSSVGDSIYYRAFSIASRFTPKT